MINRMQSIVWTGVSMCNQIEFYDVWFSGCIALSFKLYQTITLHIKDSIALASFEV